jgi:hypothetical protein
MSRKLLVFLGILVLVGLTTTTVFAGKYRVLDDSTVRSKPGTGAILVKPGQLEILAATEFSADVLFATGSAAGLGKDDVNFTLVSTGTPNVMCRNQGGNLAPGQNPPKITLTGPAQFSSGSDPNRKNGRSPFDVTANNLPSLTAVQWGCPNNNWTAIIDSVNYTAATITVQQVGGANSTSANFSCVTTSGGTTCTRTN